VSLASCARSCCEGYAFLMDSSVLIVRYETTEVAS
jgi:hypothetical protein